MENTVHTFDLVKSLMAQTAIIDCPAGAAGAPVFWTVVELQGRELHLVTRLAKLHDGTHELQTRATVYRRSGDQLIHSPNDFLQIVDWKKKASLPIRPIVARVQHQAQLARISEILGWVEAYYANDTPGQEALWEIALSANRDPVARSFNSGVMQ